MQQQRLHVKYFYYEISIKYNRMKSQCLKENCLFITNLFDSITGYVVLFVAIVKSRWNQTRKFKCLYKFPVKVKQKQEQKVKKEKKWNHTKWRAQSDLTPETSDLILYVYEIKISNCATSAGGNSAKQKRKTSNVFPATTLTWFWYHQRWTFASHHITISIMVWWPVSSGGLNFRSTICINHGNTKRGGLRRIELPCIFQTSIYTDLKNLFFCFLYT